MTFEISSTYPDGTKNTDQVTYEQSDFALFTHMILLNYWDGIERLSYALFGCPFLHFLLDKHRTESAIAILVKFAAHREA